MSAGGAGAGRRQLWLALACVVVYGTLGLLSHADGLFYYYNVLFNGDVPRVVADFTRFDALHTRTTVHPIVPLLTLPFGVPLARLLQAPELAALCIVVLTGTGAVLATHALLRTLVSEAEALALALLYATSSSSLLLFSLPETFALSALGIALTAYAVRKNAPFIVRAAAAVLLFGALTTNLIHVLATEFLAPRFDLRAKLRRAAMLVAAALAGVGLLNWVQQRLVPNTRDCFGRAALSNESPFFAPFHSLGQVGARLGDLSAHFLSYALVAPAPRYFKDADEARERVTFLDVWRSGLAGHSALSVLVALAYLALLAWTVLVHVRSGMRRTETWSVAFVVAAHFGLFFFYGDDFLLYSPVWVVEIMLGIALAFAYAQEAARWRPPVTAVYALAGAAFLCNGAVVADIFEHFRLAAVCYYPGAPCAKVEPQRWLRAATATSPKWKPPPLELTGRVELRAEMARRPGDHWSTRVAHVLLAEAGSGLDAKAYYEVGGNLTPALGTFGLSFATAGANGKLLSASTDEPERGCLDRWQYAGERPAIASVCPDRVVHTELRATGHFEIAVKPRRAGQVLLVRSAGPAGGPLWHVVQLEPGVFRLNDAWTLRVTPAPRGYVGLELDGLDRTDFEATEVFDVRGWAFLRLALEQETHVELTRDGAGTGEAWPPPPSVAFSLRLPDERVTAMLDASWFHLRASITDGEVRPGDPTHYALPWLRDGAYVLSALARTGDQKLVERVAPTFARQDFFGGFGSEADAPGYALWALDEAAALLDSPSFVANIFPAVERKVSLIERMRRGALRVPPEGPVLPSQRRAKDKDRVADEPRGGCIAGRMDHQVPLYLVNGVSYQGLRSAARLADLRGDGAHASAWREAAADLAHRCSPLTLDPAERTAARTAVSAIWPTFFGKDDDEALRAGLEEHWQQSFGSAGPAEMPPWTYFLLAEAHQWLYLGKPERARATLAWFSAHDATRGLYALPEGRGETSNLWHKYRGWWRDEPIVPHYWAAAELALLALDMLALEDERTTPPTIVVGAGLDPAWVRAGSVSFDGVRTRSARVSLTTEGGVMKIRVAAKTPVRVVASAHLSGIRTEIAP